MRSAYVPISWSLAAMLTLVGCSSSIGMESADPAAQEQRNSSVMVDNCGTTVFFEQQPEKVVTIKSTSTEMLLSLGLEDRIVGTAFEDSPLPDDLSQKASNIPKISENVPGQESILELSPDFVYAGWESNFGSDSVGTREQLEQMGINTYVSPAACRSEEHQPEKLTFDAVFAQIQEMGEIFDVPDVAATLVAEQQAILDEVEPVEEGLSALWYSSGSTTPYVGAGSGAPAMIMEELGFENIADGVSDTWTELSWEVVAEADPDVLILIDSEWNTVENKIEILETSPVTSELQAVKDKNYLTLPFAASEAGVRNAEAVKELANQLESQ